MGKGIEWGAWTPRPGLQAGRKETWASEKSPHHSRHLSSPYNSGGTCTV